MSDIEALAIKIIELIPEIVEKKPELAFRMFEILKKYFVPIELFQEYLRRLDRIEKKVGKIEEDVAALKKDVSVLKEDVSTLKKDVSVLKEDVSTLKKDVSVLKEDVSTLKKDVSVLKKDVSTLKKDMSDVKKSLDRLMLSLEEEAREYVKWRLSKYNIVMEPRSETICGMEINLFDAKGNYVLFGDATVRAGPRIIEWIVNRAKKLAKCVPEYRDKQFIVVIYAMRFTPDAIDKAKEYGVWLVTATKEETRLKTLRIVNT